MLANNTKFNKRQAEIIFYTKHGKFVSRVLCNMQTDLSLDCYTCVSISPIDMKIMIEIRNDENRNSPIIGTIEFISDNLMGKGINESLYYTSMYDGTYRHYTSVNMMTVNSYTLYIDLDR